MKTLYGKNDSLGEFFGSSILVLDIENDGDYEIVVGAPFYSTSPKLREIGRVYLYNNISRGIFKDFQDFKTILSPMIRSGSRFGTSLASLDLNLDRFNGQS